MSLFKLDNVIQNYAWGSKHAISHLFGINNPKQEPQAEIWMGVHPNGCSKVIETGQLLSDVLRQNPEQLLGDYTAKRFGNLPFLFKVLSADAPLSIQVHPNKHNAEMGFLKENLAGIPPHAANRNYKDANHKPELIYALTPYKAMNGFRPIKQILSLFQQANLPSLTAEVAQFKKSRNKDGLRSFFKSLMSLDPAKIRHVLCELDDRLSQPSHTALARKAFEYIRLFKEFYKEDIGLLAPLLLNIVELAPGEAMFLHTETPHAYVQGTSLEIMANSDNVLRAGLTPKYIDLNELIANTRFEPIKPRQIKLHPIHKEDRLSFPVPVDDFGLDIIFSDTTKKTQFVRSPEIIFCINGKVTLSESSQEVILNTGESVFVGNDAHFYTFKGQGTLARAYN
ncbi:mannose-6-phosphate isomerase, class I [Zooshikella sp. RANM57]|uniref:mannose-6-phosphate isomerase, class I n=1 Tax=Zooshikella sp. RANM57 TaxID=3425863 RepID=UPI003D6E6ABC